MLEHDFATQGQGHWGAPNVGAQYSVVDGVFNAQGFGNDDNHVTSKGGPGRIFLTAFADHHYFRYVTSAGVAVGSDLTNALFEMEVRGANGFELNPAYKFIAWLTADHPDHPPWPAEGWRNVNWAFTGEPREITTDWAKVEWQLVPDESKWTAGGGIDNYGAPLSLRESLQNTYNLHTVILGPDNAVAPSGAFQMRKPRIIFNRNGPGLAGPSWDAATKAPAVTLSSGELLATHAPFSTTGGVRGNTQITGKRYWEGKHVSGDITKSFAFGVCNSSYLPGGVAFPDTANGWAFLTERLKKRHDNTETAWGAAFAAGDVYMVALDKNAGKVWFGRNGSWFNGGDPASGANPAFDNLTGDLYPAESSNTSGTSWVWRANFGAETFVYAPPAGFSGLVE